MISPMGMFLPDMITDATEKDWNDFWHGPDINSDTQTNMTDQQMSATIYKQLFTDSEWDAISSAMKDYADYGDDESNIADSIDAKISAIYNLTK